MPPILVHHGVLVAVDDGLLEEGRSVAYEKPVQHLGAAPIGVAKVGRDRRDLARPLQNAKYQVRGLKVG